MEIVDYAMPMMKIEKYIRRVHDLCLERKYDEASFLCAFITVEARVLNATLTLMQIAKDKQDEKV